VLLRIRIFYLFNSDDHTVIRNQKTFFFRKGYKFVIDSLSVMRKRDDGYILVTGMNYSKNFKIFRIQKDQVTVVSEKYLGGTVNSVCINKDQTAVYAGTSKGSVLGFDSEGNGLWHVFVKDSVKKLYEAGESVTAICENGRVCTLSKDGSILGFGCLPEKPICFEKCDDEIWIGCGNEIVLI
jgi:WD40 repeat protein